MAKISPNVPDGWEVESFVVAKLLSKDSKVLFIYNEDYERIKKIQEVLHIQPYILNDNYEELEKARKFGFDVISGNVNGGALEEYADKEFDYVVCEDELHSARYPNDFLRECVRVCHNLVLCNKNKAYWKKRIKFFFRGSLYVENQYDVYPDDEYAWFNKYPWNLAHKDIVNLCACNDFLIKSGIIIYGNGKIDNIFDIRSYPNWSAKKVYYLISDENSTENNIPLKVATI